MVYMKALNKYLNAAFALWFPINFLTFDITGTCVLWIRGAVPSSRSKQGVSLQWFRALKQLSLNYL